MKKLLLYLVLWATICSCDLAFEQPQPRNIEKEDIFPRTMQGIWDSDGDELIISELTYAYTGGLFDMNGHLSDSVILKYHKNYYYLNIKEYEKNYWYVFVIYIQDDNKLQIYPLDSNDIEVEKLNEMTKVREVFKDNGDLDYYLINPTITELETMQEILNLDFQTFTRQQENE
jgi:hypothetical protein